MKQNKVRGNQLDEDDDDRRKDRTLRDGEVLRVPLMLMDGSQRDVATRGGVIVDAFGRPAGHRPGCCLGPRDPADPLPAAYAAYERELVSGRNARDGAPPEECSIADAYAAYEDYLVSGRNARDGAPPEEECSIADAYAAYEDYLRNARGGPR
jgi:hypothetical protein